MKYLFSRLLDAIMWVCDRTGMTWYERVFEHIPESWCDQAS